MPSISRYYPSKRKRNLQPRRNLERYKYTDRPYEWQKSSNEEFQNDARLEMDDKKARVDQSVGNYSSQSHSNLSMQQLIKKVCKILELHSENKNTVLLRFCL